MHNYPDGMDWKAYDDYHDPKLECGHNSSDSCDCWCEHYLGDGRQHLIGDCTKDNCSLLCCEVCGEETNEGDSVCASCELELGEE